MKTEAIMKSCPLFVCRGF